MSWVVECDPDFLLVSKGVGISRREIIHRRGKGRVLEELRKRGGKGLVDEDPGSPQPSYLGEMVLADQLEAEGLRVLADRLKGSQVIVLCPRLEEWLLGAAREADIDFQDFGFPKEPNLLHRALMGIKRDQRRRLRFEELLEILSSHSKRFEALKRICHA